MSYSIAWVVIAAVTAVMTGLLALQQRLEMRRPADATWWPI